MRLRHSDERHRLSAGGERGFWDRHDYRTERDGAGRRENRSRLSVVVQVLEQRRQSARGGMPLAFGWGLRAVADHGFRPGNVVYWVLSTLFVFWLIFWFGLKIVAFEPEEKQVV